MTDYIKKNKFFIFDTGVNNHKSLYQSWKKILQSDLPLATRKSQAIGKFLQTPIFITVESSVLTHFILSVLFFKRYFVTLHNINYFLKQKRQNNIFNKLKALCIKFIFFASKEVIVNSFEQQAYLRKLSKKKSKVVPFQYIFTRQKDNLNNTVIVPGIIDEKRRNYNQIVSLAKEYKDFNFIMLGNISNASTELKKTMGSVKNITIFNTYVEDNLFDNYMRSASILLSLSTEKHESTISIEDYGISKDTGSTHLQRIYGIITVYSKSFPIPSDLECISYRISEIDYLINKIRVDRAALIKAKEKFYLDRKKFEKKIIAQFL